MDENTTGTPSHNMCVSCYTIMLLNFSLYVFMFTSLETQENKINNPKSCSFLYGEEFVYQGN